MDGNKVNTLLYIVEEGAVSINVILDSERETMWTTQKTMAELFNVDVRTISAHIKNIFTTGELDENLVLEKIPTVANDGKTYNTNFYNLEVIISVGYRVNSIEGTNFRKWANKVLNQYMIKGFVLDDELLSKGQRFDKDYFDELLERIREIRSSERRFNQKITDIYATSYDYNKDAKITREFFFNVQDKLLYAVSEKTASEIIFECSDINKPNMGLTTWSNKDDKILKRDVMVSKNYLNKKELQTLNNLVDGFLTIAETRYGNNIPTSMKEWVEILDSYIRLNQLPELKNKGKILSIKAKENVLGKFEEYRKIQDKTFESDYDKFLNEIKRLQG